MTGRSSFTEFTYIDDIDVPGMLVGRPLLSEHAAGRVADIDSSACHEIDGFVGIVTAKDLGSYGLLGSIVFDRPILASDNLRYVGEPIAIVVGRTALAADLALGRVRVTYLEYDRPHRPIHDVAAGYEVSPEWDRLNPDWAADVCHRTAISREDAEEAISSATLVLDQTYESEPIAQLPVEPHGAIAQWDAGDLLVWSNCQHPFAVRHELARAFGLRLNRVRVRVPRIGGGFGAKSWTRAEPFAVACAAVLGAPVKVMLRTSESALLTRRHPGSVRLRTGFDGDGRILGRQAWIELDTGAYADSGPRVLEVATTAAIVPYRIPAYDVAGVLRFSRNVSSGAMRAIGSPQVQWAGEMQLNEAARRLGLDPWLLRRRNLATPADEMVAGYRQADPITPQVINAIDEAWHSICREQRERGGEGRGVAIGLAMTSGGASPASTAVVRVASDESVTVLAGSSDMGQGSHRTLVQVVAEELAVPLDAVVVRAADTGYTPYDYSTGASRSTTFMGTAVRQACRDLIEQARTLCSRFCGASPESLKWREGAFVGPTDDYRLADIVALSFGPGGELLGRGWSSRLGTPESVAAHSTPLFWEFGAAIAVASAPPAGEPRVEELTVVGAPGRVVNRLDGVGRQEAGGAIMGLGAALFELAPEAHHGSGYSVRTARVPLLRDIPVLRTHAVEDMSGPGPTGERGVGECSVVSAMAAVMGACAEAYGAPLTRSPVGAMPVMTNATKGSG